MSPRAKSVHAMNTTRRALVSSALGGRILPGEVREVPVCREADALVGAGALSIIEQPAPPDDPEPTAEEVREP